MPKRRNYDFIIIHGAALIDGLYPTPLLTKRIDKAINLFETSTNPNIKIIPSGGKGIDEKISEAQAITNYLIEKGIPEESIILEDKSTTTYENLKFSKELGDSLVSNPRYIFVTNDYHVLRTSLYARKLKLKGDGQGCKTAGYYLPSAFIREYIAIVVRLKWLFVLIYLFLITYFIYSQL